MVLYSLNNLKRKIEFLKSLPIFSKWNRDRLAKLSYYFTEFSYKRNHDVFKEGTWCEYFYIVIDGEFEATRNITIKNKYEECNLIKDCITSKVSSTTLKMQNERYK